MSSEQYERLREIKALLSRTERTPSNGYVRDALIAEANQIEREMFPQEEPAPADDAITAEWLESVGLNKIGDYYFRELPFIAPCYKGSRIKFDKANGNVWVEDASHTADRIIAINMTSRSRLYRLWHGLTGETLGGAKQ